MLRKMKYIQNGKKFDEWHHEYAILFGRTQNKKIHNGYAKWGTSEYISPLVATKQPNKGPHAGHIATDYTEVQEGRRGE